MTTSAGLRRHIRVVSCAVTVLAACGLAFASDLSFSLGSTGLKSVAYRGQQFLASSHAGEMKTITPSLRWPDGTVSTVLENPRVEMTTRSRITSRYSWGEIDCSYSQSGQQLRFAIRITNTSGAVLETHAIKLLELAFVSIPEGKTLDAGMFGMGTNWSPLHSHPMIGRPDQMPPVVLVRFEEGMLAFVSDEDPSTPNSPVPSVPFSSSTKLVYPFFLAVGPIAAGATVTAHASIRFGDVDSDVQRLAGDVLHRYREAFPVTLDWPDRRAIGALFLATSQTHPEKNPRGWFLNAKDVDVTTAEGIAAWRARLMKYADTSIAVLKEIDAQGMITWDVEGEEFAKATYYGDPRLASTLAPETDVNGALDEYFAKFRNAGLRTGLTIRPQRVVFQADGKPKQEQTDDPMGELVGKIEYARQRWGCTLFYVDSTSDAAGASLSADIFRALRQRFPDILLFPENENLRDFAYSAPLNSYHHHNVTGTPSSVLDVYPGAFSILMATTTDEKMAAGHDALLESVRRGDILLVNAWFRSKATAFVKSIYQEAAR